MDKFIRYKLADAEFVAGEDELCFKAVLEDFKKAEYINILTFNISGRNNLLLEELKKVGAKDIPIRIISNIPGRWESYYSTNETYRRNARNKIQLYLRKLCPENIGRLSEVFFKFNNHGKIVMTNNIIYWGSANYSDESKRNFECGTISKDKKFIAFINEQVIPAVIENSVSYYEHEYEQCLMCLYSAISFIHMMFDEIEMASYESDSDYYTNFEEKKFFSRHQNNISWQMLEELMETISEFEPLMGKLENDLIDGERNHDELGLSEIVESYGNTIPELNERIHLLCHDIEELAKFDEDDYASTLLSDKYRNVAYDEMLDHYALLAFEEAREHKEELIENSEEYIIELLNVLKNYEENMFKFIDEIMKLAKENEAIDNT